MDDGLEPMLNLITVARRAALYTDCVLVTGLLQLGYTSFSTIITCKQASNAGPFTGEEAASDSVTTLDPGLTDVNPAFCGAHTRCGDNVPPGGLAVDTTTLRPR